ncbi:uncharacterized protein LOC123308512 [Coccinella septempunctata]|uniref:uncharacterized protein LOC123308512 n=1 Tax=Coccinella septempunctata TaxID=41139 RepID=UPI001D096287|nr:uncharacterized protein LOC123308512 [Coccinella septempunctata]
MKLFVLFVCNEVFANIVASDMPPGNLTDVTRCKLSHLGVEYLGYTSKTESLVRCQAWNSNLPHRVMDGVSDDDFPEGSREKAKNYCRNPNRDPKGPWCYSLNEDLVNETCAVPLCSFSECRMTGPGMEYAGDHKKTISDRNCLKWNKDRNNVYRDGHTVKRDRFDKTSFPDPDPGKKCRNPDGDPGGPWCYVENEPENTVEKDYCDVPPCDEPVCVVFTKNDATYTHFTDFNDTLDSLSFGVKLWSSDRYPEAEARLVLSVVALPVGAEEMRDLGTSVEVFISNRYCALTVNNKDEVEREVTRGILTSIGYTYFTLTWHRGFITLMRDGVTKPIFIAEYKTKDNLMGFKMDRFSYYAAQGTDVLWTFPFCLDDFECDVHTTTGHLFQQYWPLRATSIGRELSTRVRAVRSAKISLSPTPTNLYPNVVFNFKADDGYTRVVLEEYKNAPALTLKEVVLTDALDYWKWQEYSLSFFGDTFQVHWTKNGAAHLILEAKHPTFRKMRWYSVCSDNSVAHWTFFCAPPETAQPPPAFLPECSMNPQELNYAGRQDVTHDGFPCLPWSAKGLVPDLERKFFEGDAYLRELSYCRDPGKYQKGTYCYVISMLPEKTVLKKYCRLRKCKSQECRMAGTGNDYTGTLNTARSRRYCEPWYSLSYVHMHDQRYLNDSLFADLKIEDANNYCRNPSRNPIGSWCYTIDPNVPQESCSVKDCDKPEECIVILTGKNEGRRVYILPQWKEKGAHGGLQFALKRWNPERVEGVGLEITPRDGAGSIRLEIGAEGNQKVNLLLDGVLTKEKTLPHLIASGTWTEFWLQIRREEILLGYKGVPHALFEWKHADLEKTFEPTYVSFSTLTGEYVGVYFECDECHTERLSVNNVLQVYPVGVWRESEEVFGNFSLNIRGGGTVWIPLYNLIHTGDYLMLELNQVRSKVALHRFVKYQAFTLVVKDLNETLFGENRWAEFTINFNETTLQIVKENFSEVILEYNAPVEHPILIYYFTVGVDNGEVLWSANCDRLDVDGPPRDGGWSRWSDWTCSVPCGGGDGFKTRSCTNPPPNVRGRLCVGAPAATGRCNDFECGDVSPRTADRIREDLRTNFFSFVVEENEDVVIPIDRKILKVIGTESPKSRYEWTLNGMVVKEEDERFRLADGEILVTGAKPADSGLYVCTLYKKNKKQLIIRIVALAVVPIAHTFITRATRSLKLNCKTVVLGYVYSDLSLKLLLNKTTYKDYGIVTLSAANTYTFKRLRRNFTGDWKCVVEQKDLGFSWITNYEKILVMKAPNLYTNLLEDELTRPLFGWLKSERNVLVALIVIVSSSVVLVTLCLAIYFAFFTIKKRSYKRNRRL